MSDNKQKYLDLLKHLNEFNNMYSQFIQCNYINKNKDIPTPLPTGYTNLIDGKRASCNTSTISETDLTTKYKKIMDLINTIETNNIPKPTTNNLPSVNSLQNKERNIMKIRQDLDVKLNELNNVDDYPSIKTSQFNLDYITYMSLLFTLIILSMIIFMYLIPTAFAAPII
jgi:hypothetical protein